MLLLRLNNKYSNNLFRCRRLFATVVQSNEEYTETPQYPPILDLSVEKVKERKIEAYCDEVKAVKTVEEKQIKLNMPRYYGFKCHMVLEDFVPYDNLEMIQHITRTHLIKDSLPECYNKINVSDELLSTIKAYVEEGILLEMEGYRRTHDINEIALSKSQLEDITSSCISQQINRALINNLCKEFQHLSNTLVDIDPRIESTWFVGGMIAPASVQKSRKAREWLKDKAKEPVDRTIQYLGSPSLTVRSELPLAPVVPYSEAENPSFDVPFFKYDPGVVGMTKDYKRIVNIPGFWPGDSHQFGLVSFHRRGHLLEREYNDYDYVEALNRQGIMACFGWLNAQANHLGFTTYNDLTYPLVNQCLLTNGKLWNFFVYQLNTILLHSKHIDANPKRNICWASKELKLFEEIKDGKLIGFNDEVLKMICKFYANIPQERAGVELRPYLSNQEKLVADYEDAKKREWLEKQYKFLTSNRPRHFLPYEIFAWEKIYKIDNKTRPFEARRRPFELFVNPYQRKLNEHKPGYIPRKARPDVPRSIGRNIKEYYP